MEVPIIQRRVVKSISEFSVFKIALIAYLIVFILTVILMAIIALITWAGFAASGINFNDIIGNSGMGSMFSGLGLNIPNLNFVFGTGSVVGIVLFIVFGLIFSVVFAAIATFWAWVFNVILKISGGVEVRYIDRTVKTEIKAEIKTVENSNINQ